MMMLESILQILVFLRIVGLVNIVMMKSLYTTLYVALSIITISFSTAYSASIRINAPEQALSNRNPITVLVSLDTDNTSVSGIGGSFSYPTELFDVKSISIENSIVPLWIKQPTVSEDKNIDGRTHITFEGIFPGGYSGISSPYYEGFRAGTIFMVTLVPKNKGTAVLLVDDIVLNEFNQNATPIPVESSLRIIKVPDLVGLPSSDTSIQQEVLRSSIGAVISRDPLINNNAWYVLVTDNERINPIKKIYIAETNDYSVYRVKSESWKEVSNPYVLFYQDRTKYVHIKVLYTNNTYALTTLLPVENSNSIENTSRILVSIVVALSLLYLYGKKFFIFFKKKYTKQ